MVSCDIAGDRIAVYGLSIYSTFTVASSIPSHPVTGQPYTIDLDTAPAGGNVNLNRCTFTFTDGTATAVTFDPDGNPVRGTGDTASQARALTAGTVVVNAGAISRAVTVEPTGRVTAS